MKTLTFGSYNLENGGLDASMRDGRLVRQLAMLADAHADAWAIQEAKHWAADGSVTTCTSLSSGWECAGSWPPPVTTAAIWPSSSGNHPGSRSSRSGTR